MNSSELISVIAEPKAGYSTEDVRKLLESLCAEDINILAPGFISAKLPKNKFKVVEDIAHVEEKRSKQIMGR